MLKNMLSLRSFQQKVFYDSQHTHFFKDNSREIYIYFFFFFFLLLWLSIKDFEIAEYFPTHAELQETKQAWGIGKYRC